MIIDSFPKTDGGVSDRIVMRGGGSKPIVDRTGEKVLDREAVAADEQDSPR